MASLQIDHNGDPNWHTCGAILVDHRHVVTNAHCVTNFPDGSAKPAASFHLRIGSRDRTQGGVVAGVTQVLPHAEWAWAQILGVRVADIAVLRLDRYVPLQPLDVASHLAGQAAVTRLLGWGLTDPARGGSASIQLRELDTTLVRAAMCADAAISVGEICVGNVDDTEGPCSGDSGGPALQKHDHRWFAVGGASREANALCGTGPTVYTDLTDYRGWIDKVTRTDTVPPAATSGGASPHMAQAQQFHWVLAA
jgi:secreted trypsin-like serine protease